jgi:ribosomal protein L32
VSTQAAVENCPKCGEAISSRVRFCPNCGWRLLPHGSGHYHRSDGLRDTWHPEARNRIAPTTGSRILDGSLVIALILAIVFLLYGLSIHGFSVKEAVAAIGENWGPSCTVGVTGTAATVTYRGWPAENSCASQLPDKTLYQLQGDPPENPVICQYTSNGLTATVRDQGALKNVDNLICQSLQKEGR